MSFKINAVLLSTAVLVAILFLSSVYPLENQRFNEHLNKIELLLDTLFREKASVLADGFLDGNDLEYRETLDGIREIAPEIERICMYAANGNLFSCSGNAIHHNVKPENIASTAAPYFFGQVKTGIGDILLYRNNIYADGDKVGFLSIYYSMENILREKSRSFFTIVMLLFVSLALLTVILSAFLNRLLVKPLIILRNDMRKIEANESQATATDSSAVVIDEIAAVFNDMSLKLSLHKKELARCRENMKELRVIKDIAEQSSKAKGEFLASMSHEIRTPMNGVMGLTTLLLDTPLDESQMHYVQTLQSSSESLLRIINDILDFSKIEAGKMKLEEFNFNLRQLLDDFIDITSLKAEAKGLAYVFCVEPVVPSLLIGDSGRLRQILLNLTGNAIKFTHQGQVVVHVTVLEQGEEDCRLRFSIQDTGIGIPDSRKADIFKTFTQADSSITRRFGGTGLGLAISRELCSLMEGEIGFHSQEKTGSEFFFTARFKKQKSSEESPDWLRKIVGRRVLIVDHNSNVRNMLRKQLQHWGAEIGEAEGGMEAVSILQQAGGNGKPFDYAFLSMDLPDKNGVVYGNCIVADPNIPALRMVLMHDSSYRNKLRGLIGMRFTAFLAKPVRYHGLIACLSMLLTGKRPVVQRPRCTTLSSCKEKKGRILLAEDNSINQQVVIGILNKIGYTHVDAVGNGMEAIQALEAFPYSLVLMDVQMPEMDGLEATRRFRQVHSSMRNRNVPIIALTAHVMEGDKERCIAAGMNDYITKPVSPDALGHILELYINQDGGDKQESSLEAPDSVCATQCNNINTSSVFYAQELERRVLNDKSLAKTIVKEFVKDMQVQLEYLFSSIAEKDFELIKKQIHKMKGAVGNVGASRMREAIIEIENYLAQNDKGGDLDHHGKIIEQHFKQLRVKMEEYLLEP